jgi:hypothetical protein
MKTVYRKARAAREMSMSALPTDLLRARAQLRVENRTNGGLNAAGDTPRNKKIYLSKLKMCLNVKQQNCMKTVLYFKF